MPTPKPLPANAHPDAAADAATPSVVPPAALPALGAVSARISGISSMATRALLADLAAGYRPIQTVQEVFESVGGVHAASRVLAGEAFDLVLLASDAIDGLIAAGRVLAGSKTDLVHSGVAVAVRAGAQPPDIGTEHALRQAVLAASRIGYSTGPSGVQLLQLFQRWGITDASAGKQTQKLHAARPGGVANAAGSQHGLAQCVLRVDIGRLRSGAHRDGHARLHQIGLAARLQPAGGDQAVDGLRGQYHQIKSLAGQHPAGGVHPAHRLKHHGHRLGLTVAGRQIGQQRASGHRRNAVDAGAHRAVR